MTDIKASAFGYVVVTDYVEANTGKDVSDELQKIINENPHRTIYFPDGEYILSKPICTPANPANAVSLELSKFATLKASPDWTEKEAVVRLGAAEPFNTITVNGSNYGIIGGIIDGSGLANGVSIDSGRETIIREVSIKNTQIGIHIKHGANNRSSDADIMNVNIVGNATEDSIGVLVEGMDNTFTNMRIAYAYTAFKLVRGGNYLRNIHPLGISAPHFYPGGIAFFDLSGSNWYDFCYSDHYEIGFYFKTGIRSVCHNCFCYWLRKPELYAAGFKADGEFNSLLSNCRAAFCGEALHTEFLIGAEGGCGVIENPFFYEELATDKCYMNYLKGKALLPDQNSG